MTTDVYCLGCKCREQCADKEDPKSRTSCSAWLFYSDLNQFQMRAEELQKDGENNE